MRNFSFNVLGAAQSVIGKQTITLYRFSGRVINAAGLYESGYEDPVQVECSVQPVSRSMYEKMGLNFEKSYISILAIADIKDVGRDRSGDQIVFNGNKYEAIGKTPWNAPAGWNRIVCVKVDDE